jgi:general secretion pathway protein G
MDIGSYPTSDQGLQALVTPRSQYTKGGFIDRIPPDPWGNPYAYDSDGNSYTLKSLGAIGTEGGTGKNTDIDASQIR